MSYEQITVVDRKPFEVIGIHLVNGYDGVVMGSELHI